MKITDLIVTAESVQDGKRLTGYVCGCKQCRTAFPDEKYDHSRPIGLLTHSEEKYGNVRVYTDTLEFVNSQRNGNLVEPWKGERMEQEKINRNDG